MPPNSKICSGQSSMDATSSADVRSASAVGDYGGVSSPGEEVPPSARSSTCANSLAKLQPARRGKMRKKLHANCVLYTAARSELYDNENSIFT
eukprot:14492572-Ditylum_brightwellii.AAC.2